MQRYIVTQFDASTFLVLDKEEQREICICSNYDDYEDAKERAEKIASLLSQNSIESK
jgi:hypothetical protein